MAKKSFLFTLLFVALINSVWAFDFYAVCSTGQTLYYNITDASNHYVEVVCPGNNGWEAYTQPTGNLSIPASVSHGGATYSVKTIGNYAFYQCSEITQLTLPNSVVSIGDCAFFLNTLTTLTLPSSLKAIGYAAFASYSLTTITFTNSLVEFGESVFSGTPWYDNQPNGLVYAGSVLYKYKGTMPANTSINVQTGTKGIACKAFENCSNLTSITFPNTLQCIGKQAFFSCTGLTNITIPASVTKICDAAFMDCGYITTVNYNAQNCYTQSNMTYYWPFYGCSSLTTINIGSGVQRIPANLFRNCNHLTGTLSLPSSLKRIDYYAFYGCSGISGNLTIPSSVDTLGYWAFGDCSGITSITYNATNCNTQGSYNPFYNCSSVSSITIGSNVQTIPSYLFYNMPSISGSLLIPNSVVSIGASAFYNCSGITSVTLGTGLTQIAAGAFYGMTSLQSITLNSINCHADNSAVFMGGQINSLTIGNNVQFIPEWLVYGCPLLTSVTLPNSLIGIGDYAIYSCGLTGTLTIPQSVTSIGTFSMGGNSNLTAIEMLSTNPPLCGDYAFVGDYNATLIVPCGSVPAYQSAPVWSYFTDIQETGGCSHQISVLANPSNGGTVTGGGTYNSGANCTVTATPNSSYSFINWTENGTPVSSNASYSFTVTDDRTLTANFQYEQPATFTINASANPANGGTISGAGTYNQGATCTLTAAPNYGYVFLRWTENGTQVSTNPTYSFTVNGNRTLVANFQYNPPTYTISASANPANGGSVSGAGTFTEGQVCTLTASANSGFVFLKWTENGTQVSTNPTYSFTVNSNRTLVAHFQSQPNQYTITVSANPSNGGTVSGGGTYQQGQQCTVIATANSNYTFIKWTENGTQVSTNPTYSFTVNSNRTLVAHFQSQPSQYTITLSANPTNGGSVSGGGTYTQGETCTVTANANPNYSFVNWTENGTQVSTNSTYSFTVTGNRTLVAHFEYFPANYVINATAEPSYGGLVSGAGNYNQGQTCTLIATPNPNYDFVNWTEGGNVVSTTPTYSFTVNGNRTLVAHFESQVYTISVSANPSNAGTVYGGGDYSAGITCHLIAVPNSGCSFLNWTENGVVVASDPDYSFVVTGNRDMVANFLNYDDVNELENAVSVYPNPTKNKVYIEGNRLRKIEVFNAMGVLVLSEELSDSHTEIDLQHLSAGIYCLRVYTEDGAFSQSLVKE